MTKIAKSISPTPADFVNNLSSLEALIAKVVTAQKIFAAFSQSKVDNIFKVAAIAADRARISLAKMTQEETAMGIMEDKVIKNHFAAEYIYNKHRDTKTCDIISQDVTNGTKIVAEPLGVIAGIIPTTNPTSTVIFKSLIALKTRNAIIFSPHPRAKKSTVAAAKLILEAAVDAGAPQNIIGWIDSPSMELIDALLTHRHIRCILATGGPTMVKASYSSGKPALGVGAGNTPAIVDETADIKMVASSILISKTFDNGMICASEQSLVVVDSVYENLKEELVRRGAYLLNKSESAKVAKIILTAGGEINPKIVGQKASAIGALAGLKIAGSVKILISERKEIDIKDPFSHEKLSPLLAMYRARDFYEAVDMAHGLVMQGGAGHTSVLYTDDRSAERINYFSIKLPTGRLLINSPASQGGIGDLYNFRLEPSLTLGCGSWGGNSVSENVGVKHLLNYKTVAERRENMLWFKVPPKIYFKRGAVDLALLELKGKKRAFIITDRYLFNSGGIYSITKVLDKISIDYQIFFDVQPDPTTKTINEALTIIRAYEPDVIIAFGGGSPMDAAKIIWLMYERPEVNFSDISLRFMDIRKRICGLPELGKKATMVAIPTTSGTGSEVTPFAIITDDETHIKYAIADYALTPHMAIVDPNFVDSMPRGLTAASGFDVLVHAVEAYVSTMATNFTNSNALEAIKLVFKYLPKSYHHGAKDPLAREKMHYAGTIAGMAFANSFLGLCHSMAHKLGAAFNLPHGIANALLLHQIIKYNATDKPTKQAIFPQYKFPNVKVKYGQIAHQLKLVGKNDDEKLQSLLDAIVNLKKELDIPLSIKDMGISEEIFFPKLDELAMQAFDDQCTVSNPVYPLIDEIKEIYTHAYYGKL